MNRAELGQMLKKTLSNWLDDKAPKMAAALSYYTIFSLAPLLIISIAVATVFLGGDAAKGEVASALSGMVGPAGAEAIQSMLSNTLRVYGSSGNVVATIIGIIILLWGAIGVFAELQDSLNTIWKVDKKKTSGVHAFLMETLLSFSMVLGIGFLLIVSLIMSTMVEALVNNLGVVFGRQIGQFAADSGWIWQAVNFGVSFGVTALLFAAIFKVLPNAVMRWSDVWLGGTLTSALFIIGKTILGIYLGRSSMTSAFGAAGSVILILFWVYYTAQIFFFCAEFTHVYSLRNQTHEEKAKAEAMAAAP